MARIGWAFQELPCKQKKKKKKKYKITDATENNKILLRAVII